jgi:cytochrome c5
MYKFIFLLSFLLLGINVSMADDYEDEVRKRLGLNTEVAQVTAISNDDSESVPAGRSGETVYNLGCAACHNAGLAGAPLYADDSQWETRLIKGLEMLTSNAYNGYNAMPAKGLCMDCSEEEIKRSVEYMLEALTIN